MWGSSNPWKTQRPEKHEENGGVDSNGGLVGLGAAPCLLSHDGPSLRVSTLVHALIHPPNPELICYLVCEALTKREARSWDRSSLAKPLEPYRAFGGLSSLSIHMPEVGAKLLSAGVFACGPCILT